jgi:acyl-CoA reductase-like NAD-dependent aldehyde dehydrogenase
MTWLETEDIRRACKAAGHAFDFDQTGRKELLAKAAEAIEWLREQLEQDEGYIEWLEVER